MKSVAMSNFLRNNKIYILLGIATTASLIGFGDALYLTVSHYGEAAVACSLLDGCNVVLGSTWATVFGLPIALFGALYYGLLLVLIGWFYFARKSILKKLLLAVSTVGLVMSTWLLYVQIGIIGSICEYCLLSAVSTLCVWISVVVLNRMQSDTMKNT